MFVRAPVCLCVYWYVCCGVCLSVVIDDSHGVYIVVCIDWCVGVCVCRFGWSVSSVVDMITAMNDEMKSCGQGERFLA